MLKRFNKEEVGDVVLKYREAKEDFSRAQEALAANPTDLSLHHLASQAQHKVLVLQICYASYLKQQSKINWLKFNDENSKFFHAFMRKRKVDNRITSFSIGGIIEEDYPKVVEHFLSHFKNFMGKRSWTSKEIDSNCISQGNRLSVDLQVSLVRPFTKRDVRKALFSIHSCKSPGLDGFGSGFFKGLWSDIGDEISTAVLEFFQGGYLPKELNETDLLKGYTRKNISARCLMKIDLSKVYDNVDWLFVGDLLKQLYFPSRFIGWILACLKGTNYNLLMNGRIQGSFKGEKGLRQGDPMSPLLFVIVMEYLTRLLAYYSDKKGFGFHPLCKHIRLTNLCFADDLIMFCKGNVSSVRKIHEAFTVFCDSTGLSANKSKSHIYFGGVKDPIKAQILEMLQMEEGSFPLSYLGVHLRPTKWKASDCGVILDKLNKKLNCWASRNLSFAGRAQLIHSVLLGIRNFWMSIFILPSKITAAIDKSCRDFLWGSIGNRSKLHLPSWEKVCLPKKLGGVGFREGKKWNMALMANFIWAISSKQDCLWVKWISSIYLKDFDIWKVPISPDMCWYVKKLLRLRQVIDEGCLQQAVKGGKVSIKHVYSSLISATSVGYADTVWNKLIVPKHRFFYWQIFNRQLLTRDHLSRFLTLTSALCPVCESDLETHSHLFMECIFSRKVFEEIGKWLGYFHWPDSNGCIFDSACKMASRLSMDIKDSVKHRVLSLGTLSHRKKDMYFRMVVESW
ncbi:uncharacterized protein LOC133785378 [Humulus lupulus]|uniref:uncharacterized protein LOC133785378 n=1 Tax=Humulus lupulus TaxID=3486 RepID=UPI002B412314|nr:uncharacterized protein LOC133785378 [Humulus lupulus]